LSQFRFPVGVQSITLRWLVVAILMVAELAGTRNWFSFPEIATQSGPISGIIGSVNRNFSVATAAAFLVAFLATLVLIISKRLDSIVNELLNQSAYRWWPWLAAHAAGFAVFLGLSWPVFGPAARISGLSVTWLAGWLAAGIFMLICLPLIVAPAGTWRLLLYQERKAAALAILAGSMAWAGGQLAQGLWAPLTDLTLWSTYQLLSVFYADVYTDPELAILGVNSFVVEIAPSCSGFEGIALITVFTTLYLGLFRKELRFPAALLLFPVGIVVIWMTNILRIVVLVSIGALLSPDIAVGGFHSQAGWIGFSIVALGVIFLAHRFFLAPPAGTGLTTQHYFPNMRSALSLLTPLLAMMATSMIGVALSGDFAFLYPLNVLVTAAVLWHFRHHYIHLVDRPPLHAVAIGIAVGVIWLFIVPEDAISATALTATLARMPDWVAAGWVIFRILGSVFTVPIAEELAFRGYLLHKLVDTDFENVKPGTFTWRSFLLSSLLFGLMHDSWLAGTLAGAGFALALYQRGRLSDAIVAHIASNALVAIAVLGAGRWELWG
jgi:exosortase E/protease (VPEID-CTERM system)